MTGAASRPGSADATGAGAASGASRSIEVRVIPRARRDEVGGTRAGRLLVRTTAPPADGAANKAVLRLVAAHLGVPRRRVAIVAGERSRDKTIRVEP